MKKAFKAILIAILGIISAISCQIAIEEPILPEEEGVVAPQPVMRTYTCIFPGSKPDSKVTLAADGKTGWQLGDKLFVHGQKGEKGVVIELGITAGSTISPDGQTATFTAAISDPCAYSSTIFVAYPADAIKDNWDEKPYLYWSNRFKTTNAHLITGFNDTQDGGTTIHFVNLCACISFEVNGDLDSDGISDFDSYTFKGNNGETVGYSTYTVRFNNNGGDIKRFYAYVSGEGFCDNTSGAQTTINVSGWDGADGTTTNYIFIPYDEGGAKVFNGGFTIQFKNGGDVIKTVSTSQKVDLSANIGADYQAQYMPLGDITSYLKDPTPVHNATTPAITGAVDLGASETANCYVVDGSEGGNASKVFKFKARKGNSSVGVGIIKSVKVLWQTNNAGTDSAAVDDVIASVDYDKQEANDYYEICFQMPAELHAGNAVIAAYDGANGTGNILWSWHIWVPSQTIPAPVAYGFFNHPMMDRNLGALVPATTSSVPVESYGLNYQWGRKDPFVGASATGASTNAAVKGTAMSLAGATMTVDETIQNPTMFANAGDGATWMTTNDNTLWREGVKTIYDPCPPGYTVMSYDAAIPMSGDGLNNISGWSDNDGYFTLGSPTTAVFPYAGYRDGGPTSNVSYTTSRSAIWTTFSNNSSTSAYHMNVRHNSTHASGSTGKSRGLSVRCVKEEMCSSQVGGITVNTDMSDWSNVQTFVSQRSPSSTQQYHVFKATYDNTYLYLYTKRVWKDALWGGTNAYVYYMFDTDYNTTTGVTKQDAPGLERYFYLYLFQGTSASPVIATSPSGDTSSCSIDGVTANGVITDVDASGTWNDGDYVETEVRILRSNISGLTNGNTVRIYSYSNKDAYNLSTRPITIKFEN